MKVAIDTSGLYTTQAGVARYIRGLLTGLGNLPGSPVAVVPVAWEVENFGYAQPGRSLRTLYRELFWARFVAPRRIRQSGASVFHSTGSYLVHGGHGLGTVATLHDLAVLRHPARFRSWHRRSEAIRLRRLVEVDRVLCVSRFTADEAIALLGLPASKLDVVLNGCDFAPGCSIPSERAPGFRLPSEFFLFVGSIEPGKNLALIRAAYERAFAEGVSLPDLLIVGARWVGVRGEGSPPPGWHYLGRLPDEVLIYLYRRALALVFPSYYEGFGLPLAEAMSLSCPVVCSPVASLPEVVGDAAVFADQDAASYLSAMRALCGNGRLREELVSKGLVRAAGLTWTRCAGETRAVYEKARGGSA